MLRVHTSNSALVSTSQISMVSGSSALGTLTIRHSTVNVISQLLNFNLKYRMLEINRTPNSMTTPLSRKNYFPPMQNQRTQLWFGKWQCHEDS